MAGMPKATIRARIISVLSPKTPTARTYPKVSMRTPPGVISAEVNPLKHLEKTLETIPKGQKNLAKFNG